MGYHHNGESFLIEAGEQVHDLIGCLGIESAGRLVGQEYIGLSGQRARLQPAVVDRRRAGWGGARPKEQAQPSLGFRVPT